MPSFLTQMSNPTAKDGPKALYCTETVSVLVRFTDNRYDAVFDAPKQYNKNS